jgi:hypothetical protein
MLASHETQQQSVPTGMQYTYYPTDQHIWNQQPTGFHDQTPSRVVQQIDRQGGNTSTIPNPRDSMAANLVFEVNDIITPYDYSLALSLFLDELVSITSVFMACIQSDSSSMDYSSILNQPIPFHEYGVGETMSEVSITCFPLQITPATQKGEPDVDDLDESEKEIVKNNIGLLQSLRVETLSAAGVRVMQNYLEGTLNLHEDVSSVLNKNANLENIAKDTVELLVGSIADNLPYVYEPGSAILNPHLDRAKVQMTSSQTIQSQSIDTSVDSSARISSNSKGIKRSLGEINIIDKHDRRKTKLLSSSHLRQLQEPVNKKTIISHTESMLLHPLADKRDKIIMSDSSPSSDSSDNITIGELIRKREELSKGIFSKRLSELIKHDPIDRNQQEIPQDKSSESKVDYSVHISDIQKEIKGSRHWQC